MNIVIRKLLRAAAWLARALHLTRASRAIDGWLEAPAAPATPADTSVRDAAEPAAVNAKASASTFEPFLQPSAPEPPRVEPPAVPAAADLTAESFSAATHLHDGALCDYKLYAPPGPAERGRALVVMLHGCTQDADDFAAMHRQPDGWPRRPATANPTRPAASRPSEPPQAKASAWTSPTRNGPSRPARAPCSTTAMSAWAAA